MTQIDLSPLRTRPDSSLRRMGFGMIRAALLFGTVAIVGALALAPAAERKAKLYAERGFAVDIDQVMTGSIAAPDRSDFLLRRSVLSPEAEIICLSPGGSTMGRCR